MARRLRDQAPAAGPRAAAGRERLLSSGGELFARRGWSGVGVRELARHAQVNLAAVHYHFGGKEALYAALLERAGATLAARHAFAEADSPGSARAEERLGRFVRGFLHLLLAPGEEAWAARLLAREMLEPSEAGAQLLDEHVRPLFKRLCGLVAECLGKRANPELAILCARSIAAQCLFYDQSRPLLERLSPGEVPGSAQVERLAQHITRFSLRGLTGIV